MLDITPGTWAIDPAHTLLGFSVRHLAIAKVRGTFDEFVGTVVVGDEPNEVTVEGTVEVASVDTRQPQRDAHLRSGDFFLAEEYPQMTFTSTSVQTENEFTVAGDLTIRGVTKPVEFDVEFNGEIVDGYGAKRAGFEATAKINRQDFGVKWNAATEAGGLTLGDEVTIVIEGEMVLQQPEGADEDVTDGADGADGEQAA